MEKRTSTLDGKMKKIIIMLLATAILFAEPSVRLVLPPPLQKEIIPLFRARDKNADELFDRSDLRKAVEAGAERVALVYFATWCESCIKGMLRLRDSKDLLKKNNIQIVLVNIEVNKEAKAVHKWVEMYSSPEWLLIMDRNRQLVFQFGLAKSKTEEMALPQTLLLDNKLKPLLLLGTEGDDWPQALWEEIKPQTIKGESK